MPTTTTFVPRNPEGWWKGAGPSLGSWVFLPCSQAIWSLLIAGLSGLLGETLGIRAKAASAPQRRGRSWEGGRQAESREDVGLEVEAGRGRWREAAGGRGQGGAGPHHLRLCQAHLLPPPLASSSEAAGDLGSVCNTKADQALGELLAMGIGARIPAGCAQHPPGVRTGGCMGPWLWGRSHCGCLPQTPSPGPCRCSKLPSPPRSQPLWTQSPLPTRLQRSVLFWKDSGPVPRWLSHLEPWASAGSLSQSLQHLQGPPGSPQAHLTPSRAREFPRKAAVKKLAEEKKHSPLMRNNLSAFMKQTENVPLKSFQSVSANKNRLTESG